MKIEIGIRMKNIILMATIIGLIGMTAGCGGGQSNNEEADLAPFLDTLQQLEAVEREDGIVTLIQSAAPMLGADAAALDKAEYGFEYMKNVGEYRKNVTIFGIEGFLDIGVSANKISTINFYMAEHATEFNQGEVKLIENIVSELGNPESINFHGEPQADFKSIISDFIDGDEYSDISFNALWNNVVGTSHSFYFEKEFAIFKNRNLSYYIFK